MPLPDGGNEPWPPPALHPVYERINSWSAWYSGDPDEIAAVYRDQGGNGFDSTSRARVSNRPSQYRGGVVGALSRWFWGAPTPLGERRAKLHVPLAGDIAAKSSKLLFAEPPAFTLGGDHENSTTTRERLDELVDDSIHATLLESGEVAAGLGGVYLRVVWDRSLINKPWINAVHADAAVPEWRWGRLAAVTFWRDLADDGNRVMRHLERHEPGVILHGLFEGNSETLGRQVPLTAHADTAQLVADVDDAAMAGDTLAVDTGVTDRLTCVYVPNIRPNRVWRKLPAAAHLGRADYQAIEPELDALDEVWTSWMRDIRLAKGRIVVPDVYLQNNGPGQGATFDADREVYSTLNMLPGKDAGGQITVSQFAIRVDEHLRTAQEITIQAVRSAGYAAQSFGLQGDVAVTATEVTARERDSFLTRSHKMLYWRPALAEIVETLLAVDRIQFGTGITPQRPDVDWPDGVATDPEQQARTLQLLDSAAAVSTQTKVELLHPDWDEKRVAEEVRRIRDEQGAATADPIEVTRNIGATGTVDGGRKPDDDAGNPDDVDGE